MKKPAGYQQSGGQQQLRVALIGSLPPEHGGVGSGGIAVHTGRLATSLAAEGLDITVFADDYRGRDGDLTVGGFRACGYRHPGSARRAVAVLKGALLLGGIPSRPQTLRGLLRASSFADTFAHLLTGGEFDLVHAHGVLLAGLAAATKRRGIPLIATVHSLRGHAPEDLFFQDLIPGLFNAEALITVSDHLRREALEYGLPADRLHVIPNGVDTNTFFPVSAADARKAVGVDGDAFVVLQVGHLISRKGLDVAIRAFACAFANEPRAHLFAVGGTQGYTDREWLQMTLALPRRLGISDRVHFVGGIATHADKRLNLWYNASDVVILPSRAEGMGLVILEAMACAKPVVGSRVGGIPDVIREGETGLLVPGENVEALGAALRLLFENHDLARNLGMAGLVEAQRSYSWSGVAVQVNSVYATVLDSVQNSSRTQMSDLSASAHSRS